MTELRNRPGEILDRVTKGEAFVIERNGRRQACVVPLSVFFPDVSPCRIADELEELVAQSEEPRTTITPDRELAFRFMHHFDDRCSSEVKIVLPHGYPNTCPRVYASSISADAPHRWADGALCLYGVMTGWNPGKHTVLSTLKLTRRWLKNYDSWRKVGKWPAQDGGPSND